jgi:O-acetyl-ADP-ribose deacetylase (regulator of RNase III)
MITRGQGNLLLADVEALVNTVNTVGVMGKGIALQFKRAYPENFASYKAACDTGLVSVGSMHVFPVRQIGVQLKYIVNFPTKRHWRSPSRLEDIQSGLVALRDVIIENDIKSIAIPPLGCGNGGLDWRDVQPLIQHFLGTLPSVEVRVWEPSGTPPPESMPVKTAAPPITFIRAAFLVALDRYIQQSIMRSLAVESRISLLEAQKVVYFMQKFGFSFKLSFEKGLYGPYSQPLDRAVSAMEGHHVLGYGDGTSGSQATLELNADSVRESEALLRSSKEFDRSYTLFGELVSGFEDAFGLELLSTVLFAAEELVEPPADPMKVAESIRLWSGRKERLFADEHVKIAWERLMSSGLLTE